MRADYENGKVYVKQLGPQPAYLDGLSIGRGNELSTIDGSEITLIDNGPTYKLKFHFLPNNRITETVSAMVGEDASSTDIPAKRIRQDEMNWSTVDKGSLLVCMYGQVEEIISENKKVSYYTCVPLLNSWHSAVIDEICLNQLSRTETLCECISRVRTTAGHPQHA